jgi:hypothetical protein
MKGFHTMDDFTLGSPAARASAQVSTGDGWEEQYAHSLGIQAYVWGFPWIYNAQLRWLWTTPEGRKVSKDNGKPDLYAPVNSFHRNDQLANPDNSRSGGSPNCDTLYATAWLDVTHDPIVISVPAVTDRFYCIEMVCMDADNFAYVGTRSTGTEPGNYLIAGPGWSGTVPAGVLDILPRSRTVSIFLLGRTGVNDSTQDDLNKAIGIQAQYRLTPLSLWPNTPPPIPSHVLVPDGFDYNNTAGAWRTMNAAMTQNPPGLPPGIAQDQLLKLFATVGVGPGQDIERQSEATRAGLQRAAQDALAMLKRMAKAHGKQINGWTYPPLDLGRAGQSSDFITRAALQSLAGICANDPAEAVYLNAFTDDRGDQLNGGGRYRIMFGAGDFPPCDATRHGFWSITMYGSDYNLVADSSHYTINGYYPKYQDRDAAGGMTILIQNDDPGQLPPGTYWLQSPATDTFYLILRVYVPDPPVSVTQTWAPPQIVRLP